MCVLAASVTAGNSDQIQACLDVGLLSIVIDLLIVNEDEEVSNECSYALANSLTGGSLPQLCHLVSHTPSALFALNIVLKSSKEPVLRVALESLERILRTGDDLLYEGADRAGLSRDLCDRMDAGEHPFTELVAHTCLRSLAAIESNEAMEDDLANVASGILQKWWNEGEVEEILQAQEKEETQRKEQRDKAAAEAAAAATLERSRMSEEDRMVEAMEQTRITEQKARDEAAMETRTHLATPLEYEE